MQNRQPTRVLQWCVSVRMIAKNHRVEPTTAVPIKTGLAVALEGVAGAVVLLEVVFGAGEVHVDVVIRLEVRRDVGNSSMVESSYTDCALSVTGP